MSEVRNQKVEFRKHEIASDFRILISDSSVQQPEPAAVPGVDRDVGAHAGAQRRIARMEIELDLDAHPLGYFHPVSAGVLRREDREAGVRVIRPPHALGFLDRDLPRPAQNSLRPPRSYSPKRVAR